MKEKQIDTKEKTAAEMTAAETGTKTEPTAPAETCSAPAAQAAEPPAQTAPFAGAEQGTAEVVCAAAEAEVLGELTAAEREIVSRYAARDPEIRRTIVADYLKSVRAGTVDEAPRVLSGAVGIGPVLPPRSPRSLYEAGQIAQAMFNR
ncbi:hypothetical protein FACS1894211_04410 [Clostridia bacterium]|nr:hypothetical protein FACS1894211_04410 [Clostridia bacterium]